MKGIVLASHGLLAKGMFETTQWFFGTDISQYTWISLNKEDNVDEFAKRLQAAVDEVDSGDGVILLCDLFGGSPCNCAGLLAGSRVQVIAGMNLAMVMELLSDRLLDGYDMESLIQAGKDGIVDVNRLMEVSACDEAKDDLFD